MNHPPSTNTVSNHENKSPAKSHPTQCLVHWFEIQLLFPDHTIQDKS